MSNGYVTEELKEQQELIIPEIRQIYGKLHSKIDGVSHNITHLIQNNESQFLLAYRDHIKRIKKQLYEIKQKSQEQQRMFSANDRINYLQKSLTQFRQQSARTYQSMQKKLTEGEQIKTKYENLLNLYKTLELNHKELIKQNKILQGHKQQLEEKMEQLKLQVERKNISIEEMKMEEIKSTKNNDSILNLLSLKSSKMEHKVRKPTNRYHYLPTDNQYKEYFSQCVRVVKKQIQHRKNSFSGSQLVNSILSFQQFREIDKWKVMEMFFGNPKLEKWMYQELFPSAIFSMQSHLPSLKHRKFHSFAQNQTFYKQ